MLAGIAWWSTADQMAGMDAGPGTDLGALGWFLGVWVVMMAAMMFPSIAPTVALYARMTRGAALEPPAAVRERLPVVWARRGLVAYGLFAARQEPRSAATSAWHAGGRWFAGGVLVVAAIYELTPLKDVCLAKCRSPLGFLLGSWRDGPRGALRDGHQARRLVRRLLLGADGRAVRPRCDEPRLDGVRRGADRGREARRHGRAPRIARSR